MQPRPVCKYSDPPSRRTEQMPVEAGSGRPFVGRGETLEALRFRLEEVRKGDGGVTLLEGETGVGKSTLIAEFVPEIRSRGVRVLIGRGLAQDDPPPFSLLQSAIESARDDPMLQSDEDPLGNLGPVLIGFAPGLGDAEVPDPVGIEARLLDVLGGTKPGGRLSPDEVLSGIGDRFLEFTRHGPTVLILEDVHRADRSSLAAVEFFANELQNRPLWILATTRPAASLSAPGRTRLESFETATRAGRLALRPMTSAEAGEYLRSTDPSREISADEVARRFSETGGNPLLLQQLDARASVTNESHDRSGSALYRLDAEARTTLEVAAVLGPEFPFELLLRAGDANEETLTEVIDRLVSGGFLFERPGEILGFPEDRLREEAYGYLPDRRRRLLHARAAEALEAMGNADLNRVYALARHFYLGRVSEKSVFYNRRAAAFAERALAPDVAWDHYAHALESQREWNPDDRDGEAELVLELARITEELGVLKDAEEILREFFDRVGEDPRFSPARRAALEIFLSRVLTDRGDQTAAVELANRVLRTPGLDDQLLVRLGAHHQLGLALYYQGRYADALAHHTEELELARRVGKVEVVARAQVWRVAALAMMGQTEQAIAEAREVTALRDGWGSVRESAMAHLFFGDILADARSPPAQRQEAISEYAVAIRFAENAKDPRRIGWALYKTSELLREGGRLEEAAEDARRAGSIFEQIGDQVGLSMSYKVRGQIATDQKDFDTAGTELLEAQRLLEGLNHALEEIDVVLRRAQLSLAQGDRAGTLDHVADLERRNLPGARPDLLEEFDRLRQSLSGGGDESRAP